MEELDDVRWRAVQSRDDRHDGLFVYAVRTTKIYCRPGCGARRPLRGNVEYFATPLEAQMRGYRACRRCRPEVIDAESPARAAVIEVCRRLERSSGESPAELAAAVGYSERHLRRSFAELMGVSLTTYQRAQRARVMRDTLRDAPSVTEAIIESGYRSMRAFYDHDARQLGMTPQRYRDGARGERLRFTSVETPLGVVLVASTDRGVCSIQVGPDESEMVTALHGEFAHATIERDDEGMAGVALVLAGAVRGERDAGQLPLDVEGTAFQIRVWEALRAIPAGETRSYAQVATAIGAPRAVRAVGSACGANVVAIAVPCHRVVRSDGSLGGYRWGVERKSALLIAEKKRPAS